MNNAMVWCPVSHIVNGKLRKKAGPSFTALGKRKD